MKTLVVGMGEVGRAHYEILKDVYPASGFDLKTGWQLAEGHSETDTFEILHIATPWLGEAFVPMVQGYIQKHKPKIVNVLTTVLPGTCSKIGINAVHSTTRGLHPNLAKGLKAITKHVGGPLSEKVARYFEKAGIRCMPHNCADTTETAHLLNNLAYASALAFADEAARVCRFFGVDYYESVMLYTQTHNQGFERLDHKTKRRMILTPPNGKIGGHCLTQNAQMLAPILRAGGINAPLIEMIEKFNG